MDTRFYSKIMFVGEVSLNPFVIIVKLGAPFPKKPPLIWLQSTLDSPCMESRVKPHLQYSENFTAEEFARYVRFDFSSNFLWNF
jgi:hypothetical protein